MPATENHRLLLAIFQHATNRGVTVINQIANALDGLFALRLLQNHERLSAAVPAVPADAAGAAPAPPPAPAADPAAASEHRFLKLPPDTVADRGPKELRMWELRKQTAAAHCALLALRLSHLPLGAPEDT